MRCLLSYIFISALLITSGCSEKKKDLPETSKSETQADSLTDIDKKIRLFENSIEQLRQIPDSLKAYINLNRTAYDSVSKWKPGRYACRYLEANIACQDKIANDSKLKKEIAYAYTMWCYGFDPDEYNEDLVAQAEKAYLFLQGDTALQIYKYFLCNNLGIQYNILGDLKKAVSFYTEAVTIAKAVRDTDYYTSVLDNYTIALNELGLYDSTIHIAEEILPKNNYEPKRKAKLYANLGEAYWQKQMPGQSITVLNHGLSFLWEKFTEQSIDTSTFYEIATSLHSLLGQVLTDQNDFATAGQHFTEALQSFLSLEKNNLKNRTAGKLLLAQAKLYEKSNYLDLALRLSQKALYCVTNVDSNNIQQLPEAHDLYTENTIMEALDRKASILEKMCKQSAADTTLLKQVAKCYALSFLVEKKLMRGFMYDESLLRQAAEAKARSEKAIGACYRLYVLTGASTWAQQGLQFAESSKAIVLQESVKRNIAGSKLRQDTTWRKVQYCQQLVATIENEIIIRKDSSAVIAGLKRTLAEAEQNLLAAKTALMQNNEGYREAVMQENNFSVEKIRSELLDNTTAFTEYYCGNGSQYIFHVYAEGRINFFKADTSLLPAATRLMAFFSGKNEIANQPEAYQQSALQLYKLLRLNETENKGISKMVIVTDGLLSFIPFEALVTQVTGQVSPRQFSYLLNTKQISYGFSAVTLINQERNQPASGPISCFAPVFAGNERGNKPLVYSEKELNSIKEEKPSGSYYTSANASMDNFRKSTGSSIIHIASHANADTSTAVSTIEFYDSSLYLGDIYAMHIPARLVVLSACETGIGKIDKSEGAMSIARAFYYAGARNVITSLWNVDDKSTGELFGRFYHNISGTGYGDALRKSKLEYIRNAPDIYSSPYYWASFIHIGRDKTGEKSNPFPHRLLIAGLVIIIIFLGSVLIRKK